MQNLQKYLPKTLEACPDYRQKISDLFRLKQNQTISSKHLERSIIINPKVFFNLIQSNFLIDTKRQNLLLYYELKTQVLTFIKFLIESFPLNAKFIYEEAFIVIENNRKINFITYLIKDAKQAFKWRMNDDNLEKTATFKNYQTISTSIFYQMCNICTLRTSELKLITNSLTDFYYQQKIHSKLIGHCFRLLDAGLQERNITPYLYFVDNNKNDSVKVLFSNNKWPFAKGMTVFIWLNSLKQANCHLLWMKTDDNNEMIIKIADGKLMLQSISKENKIGEMIQICQFPSNVATMVGIELEPMSEGLFKSTSYNLNININGSLFPNITSKIPKFQSSQFITEFSLLKGFIGNLYSFIVTTRPELKCFEELSKFSQYGICRQTIVWNFIDSQILKKQSIICIFNPERNFEGLLLNYVSQKNHACYQGKISIVKYHKYDSKIIEIYLPFLYLMNLVKQKDQEWQELFDLIMQHILQIIGKENYEIDSILLILYFLEISNYRISQSTLNCLYEHADQDNFYLNLVIKYLDVHALIGRGLNILQNIQPFESPVQKTIFMFLLESMWCEKWNNFQGFEGWWSPSFFQTQNDSAFNPKNFQYDEKRQNRVEWSVLNLVTKDYCKCFIQPVFLIPKYAQCAHFQQEYVKKQCFNEYLKLNINKQIKHEILICKKYSNSGFDKFKSKVFGNNETIETPKKKANQAEIKQFSTECLFVDILTVIQGQISINKQGFVIFASSHKGKQFDHMCIKAFKNEMFYYLNIPFGDIRKVYKKRFNSSNNALYIKTKDGKEMMFHFHLKNVDTFLGILQNFVKVKKDSYNNYLNSHQPFQWIDKKMSNYEYLQWLNEIAGRNYNDITQYPVLPWVYVTNQQISGQQDSKSYRDLKKNMGSHGEQFRIKHFLEKYQSNNQEQLFNQYHFGTHYSSSAIIFNYLIRIRPYSVGALTLQSGKFDCADRIFYSYYGSWVNAISSPTDVRQLIPQIYTLPEMFINKNNYAYGLTQDKVQVENVILPKWSKQNPYQFVAKLRKKLESRFVTENINNWIDLIYGYKQRGKDAIENMNIFYPLTYQNCIDLDKVTDPEERISFETQIAHFGQNPSQIIGSNPHPTRRNIKAQWEQKLVADGGQLLIQKCFLSKSSLKEEKFLFKSIFQGRNSILAIKFVNNENFFVLRKHQYYLFKILNKKSDFLSKEHEVSYELQSCAVSLNYKELSTFVPVASITDQIVIIGGFYNGNTHIIFLNEPKFNRVFKFPTSTITALSFQKRFLTLFTGDEDGYLRAFKVNVSNRQIEFQYSKIIKAHDNKINDITVNYMANLICTCSQDGSLSFYNLYSLAIIRTIRHPGNLPIHFAHISTNPLYSVVFYSKENSTIYVYSINGQYLDSINQKTGFIYNMSVLKASDSTENLVYLNAQRELFIWQLPFLRLKRKIKVKKDEFRISCFQTCSSGKMGVTGTQDGALQIIANPASY